MQWVRSIIFAALIYIMMAIMAVVFFPIALLSPAGASFACHSWCRWTMWVASWLLGLNTEVRGTPPTGAVLVAAKHQSFLDIIMIFHAVPRARFIMKRILLFSPILGQYSWRLGCIPVHRGKKGAAISQMVADVSKAMTTPGQLVIYPQGTRVAPGDVRPYKVGTAVLYEKMELPCVPVAVNTGLYWPKRGVLRRPGTAIVEFLEPIEPGLPKEEFLAELETRIETASDRLLAEGGFEKEPTS